jgi:hypothetical protein
MLKGTTYTSIGSVSKINYLRGDILALSRKLYSGSTVKARVSQLDGN